MTTDPIDDLPAIACVDDDEKIRLTDFILQAINQYVVENAARVVRH